MLQNDKEDKLRKITGYTDVNLEKCKTFLRNFWVDDYMKNIQDGYPEFLDDDDDANGGAVEYVFIFISISSARTRKKPSVIGFSRQIVRCPSKSKVNSVALSTCAGRSTHSIDATARV